MRKYFFPYIATVFLVLFIVACNSHTEKAKANPFDDAVKKTSIAPAKLAYQDTTAPEFKAMIQRLDSYYSIQKRVGFNGSVLVGYKGKILYERYYGYANREKLMPLTPAAASQLASVSKTFTAGAILFLNEKKYLNIDQKVTTYIPSFPYPEITVRMLLNHRAGLPDYIKWIPAFRKDHATPITNDIVVSMFAKHRPRLEFKPDSRFKYSNSNYAILASIIEAVTEMKYPVFMKEYIFGPLGMNNTFVYDPWKGLPAGNAISYKYNWVREPDMFADGVYGDKGIYSTVQDMYRWDQSFYKNALLNNETIEMSYGPCSFEKKGVKNYGLGWRMFCFDNGNKIIYHNGWWHGNNTVFYRFVQENFTIIILGNKYNSSIYRQAKVVYALVKNVPVTNGFETED
jgi:CubicO group peptidase (beta-lactamase class C family)